MLRAKFNSIKNVAKNYMKNKTAEEDFQQSPQNHQSF